MLFLFRWLCLFKMSKGRGPVKPIFMNDVELDSFYITEGMSHIYSIYGLFIVRKIMFINFYYLPNF